MPFLPLARAARGRGAGRARQPALVGGDRRRRARARGAVGVDRLLGTDNVVVRAAARAGAGRPRSSPAPRSTPTATRSWCSTPTAWWRQRAARLARRRPRRSAARCRSSSSTTRYHAHARAEHPRVGRLRGRRWPPPARRALEKARARALRAVPGRRRDAGHGRLHVRRADARRPGAARHPGDPGHLARRRPRIAARPRGRGAAATSSRASSTRTSSSRTIRQAGADDAMPSSACWWSRTRSPCAQRLCEVAGRPIPSSRSSARPTTASRRSSCASALRPDVITHGHDAAGR